MLIKKILDDSLAYNKVEMGEIDLNSTKYQRNL
jgi:hypothetical protein